MTFFHCFSCYSLNARRIFFKKNCCSTDLASSSSFASLSPASSTSCTFGNKLTGYLKAANCSESFTQWVMGHVCLIKIQLLQCARLGNLSLQVMKYDEISCSNWFSMGSSLNQACYDKSLPVLKVLWSLSVLAHLLQQNKNIVPQEHLHHCPSFPFRVKHL